MKKAVLLNEFSVPENGALMNWEVVQNHTTMFKISKNDWYVKNFNKTKYMSFLIEDEFF